MEKKTQSLSTEVQSLDTIFTLLSDQRRRYVVDALSEEEPPIALYDLVTPVVSLERGADPDDISADTIDEIATTLHHVHLPKLDDADVIDYATETNTVTSAQTEVLAPILENFRRC
ncbi:DUF7344 domain-containing protein [Natronorubrum sp. FCH18a]|uniref:DUF7344 domain-containing protein n=1 Tax=Natronorubrum sp. FCH18a TaxID=3447018 RepID=UPI003F518F28